MKELLISQIAPILTTTIVSILVVIIKNIGDTVVELLVGKEKGGHRIEGLYRRRTKEADMFLNSDYTGNI